MNGCWEDNNRMGQRGKELGDVETERSDEGDGRWRMGMRVMEDGRWTRDGGWRTE